MTGASQLYIASKSGHVDVVRALVEAGAAVDQANVSRSAGVCTGLTHWCCQGCAVIVRSCVYALSWLYVRLCEVVYVAAGVVRGSWVVLKGLLVVALVLYRRTDGLRCWLQVMVATWMWCGPCWRLARQWIRQW